MKKITLLFLAVLYSFSGYGQLAMEGFEGTAFPPPGWAVTDNGVGATVSWERTISNVHEGIGAALADRENVGQGNISEDWLVTPQFTVPGNGQLRFFARTTLAGNQGTLFQVRVSTNADQMNQGAYTIFQQWTENELSAVFNVYEEQVVNLNALVGQDVYVAFVRMHVQTGGGVGGDRWLLDNVMVVEQCLDPENLGVSNVQSFSANLTWTGSASSYDVEFIEGENMPGTGIPTYTGVTQPHQVTGLTAATSYTYYVRANCGGGNTGEWVGPFVFTTGVCGDAAQCLYTFNMTDTFGDGWNGNTMTVSQLGIEVQTFTLSAGSSGSVQIPLCDGIPFTLFWNAGGSFAGEVGVTVVDPFAETVYTKPAGTGSQNTLLFTGPVNCTPPTCPKPTNLAVAEIGMNSVQLSWTENGTATQWEIIVQAPGTGFPLASAVPTYVANTNPFLAEGLDQATPYEYYVRAVCEEDDKSDWNGPLAFDTTICEASEQCLYTFNMTDTFGDGWNGNTMTVSQNGIAIQTFTLAAGSSGSVQIPLCEGIPFTLFWNAGGSWAGEVGVSVVTPFAETVYTKPAGTGSQNTLLFTGPVNCTPPTCPKPTNLAVSNIDMDSVVLSWTENGTATQWEIIVQAPGTGFPATGATPTYIANTNPFLAEGLDAATGYEFYVRAVCAEDDISDWNGPATFETLICNASNQCLYTFVMTDTFGDGWNGNTMTVSQNGIPVQTFTLATGSSGTVQIPLCDGVPFTLFWNAGGSWGTEVGVVILDPFDEDIYTKPPGTGSPNSLLFTGEVGCTPPSCPKPNNLTATNITTEGATFGWNEAGSATQWEVIILPAGSPAPAPGDTGIITSDNPYIATGLTSGTSFVFYVRAICADDDISNWAGPRNFATQITNDNCADAILVPVNPDTSCGQTVAGTVVGATPSGVPTTCGGTPSDDVWFEFVAESTAHTIDLINVAGSTTDLFHVLYQGDECGNLTQLYCSDPNQSVANNLIPGQTYKIRVYTWTSTPNQTTTFNVCVGTIPPPIWVSTTQYTVPELVQDVLINSDCALVSNFTWSTGTNFGSTNGIGYFEQNDSVFPFENGLVMTTGNAMSAPGPNTTTLSDGTTAWPGDAQLEAIILAATGNAMNSQNASIVEFDFVPLADQFSFDFIFASEEYGTFQCAYSDAFAFLLTDLSTGITTNLAVVPGTSDPISVVTIRDQMHNAGCSSVNPSYFGTFYELPSGENPMGAPVNYNGITVPMVAVATVVPNNLYRMKLVIADRLDTAFDSAIFIRGGSLNVGDIELGDDFLVSQGNAICPGGSTLLESGLDPDLFSFEWYFNGGLIPDADEPDLLVTEPGTYTLEASYINSTCSASDSIVVEFFDELEAGIPQNLSFCSATGFGIFDLTQNDDLINEPFGDSFNILYFISLDDAVNNTNPINNPEAYENISNPQTIYVRAFPLEGECFATTSFELIVEDLTPQFDLTEDFSICEGSAGAIEVTPINYDESSGVVYSWTFNGEPFAGNAASVEVTEEGTYEVLVDFGGCTNSATIIVTVEPSFIPVVEFSYEVSEYCQNSDTPIITLADDFTSGGVFTSSEGLSIDPETGVIDLEGSDPGTYEVTYTYTVAAEDCGETQSHTVTITILPVGELITDFSYESPVCIASSNPLPVLPGDFTTGGIFSSEELQIDPNTGAIDLENSSPGTYEVTYTIAASDCSEEQSSTTSITIESAIIPVVDFSYDASEYCQNGDAPVITLAGDFTSGGVFSSSEGLSIDPETGAIDLGDSTPGTYEVTYNYILEEGACGENGSHTVSITILPAGDIVTEFSYTDVCIASQTNPSPIPAQGFTAGGIYTASSTDLDIDPQTGEINLGVPGTYEITYTIAASQCTEEQTHTASITISALNEPLVEFSYVDWICQNADENPLPSGNVTPGGTYSSETLTVNPQTGEIDLSSETPSGTHDITYTIALDSENCINSGTFTASIYIEASFTPITDFAYQTWYCYGSSGDLPSLVQDFYPGGTFTVTGGLTIDPDTGAISFPEGASGTYTVTYTVDADAEVCNTGNSSGFTFTIAAPVAVSIDGGCEGSLYWLHASSVDGSFNEDAVAYAWTVNGSVAGTGSSFNVSEYLSNSGASLPIDFTVTVTDGACTGSTSITVTATPCTIQKGISPGGVNPAFDLSGYNVKTLNIFNRYGRKVYSYSNYVDQWQGQDDKGNELPDGTYYYVIELAGETKTGWIYINREY